MPRASVHVGCPARGKFYTAYIQKGPRGQIVTVPIGKVCDGCGKFIPGDKPVSMYVPGQAPKRKTKEERVREQYEEAKREMITRGHLHQVGVNEKGEALWDLTPEGRAFAEDYFAKHPERRPRWPDHM